MAETLPPDGYQTDDLASIADRPIHAFPSTDQSFRIAVSDALGNLGADGALPPDQLEEALRRSYPGVRVVEQTELGSFGKDSAIYVFRDGSVGPRAGDGPGTMRYVSLNEAVQRACVRNLIARRKSKELVEQVLAAVERCGQPRHGYGLISPSKTPAAS